LDEDSDDLDDDMVKLIAQCWNVAKDPREWAKTIRQHDPTAMAEAAAKGVDSASLERLAEQMEQAARKYDSLREPQIKVAHYHRPHSQRRETRRFAGPAGHENRTDH
jgi:hypothetical protein